MATPNDIGARRQAASKRRKQQVLAGMGAVLLLVVGLRLLADGPDTARADDTTADTTDNYEHPDDARPDTRVVRPYEADWPMSLQRELFERPAEDAPTPAVPLDPTIDPDTIRRDAQRTLSLQGVVLGQWPAVLINSQRYEEGDSVAGYVIRQVHPQGVVVERDGVVVWLGL